MKVNKETYSVRNIHLRINENTISFLAGVRHIINTDCTIELLGVNFRGEARLDVYNDLYIDIFGKNAKNVVYTKDTLGSNIYHICLNHEVTSQLMSIALKFKDGIEKYKKSRRICDDTYVIINTINSKIYVPRNKYFTSEEFFDSVPEFIENSYKTLSVDGNFFDKIAILKRYKNNKLKMIVYGKSIVRGMMNIENYEVYLGRKISEKVFTSAEKYSPIPIVKKEMTKFEFLKEGKDVKSVSCIEK